jgi:hypothetical protein
MSVFAGLHGSGRTSVPVSRANRRSSFMTATTTPPARRSRDESLKVGQATLDDAALPTDLADCAAPGSPRSTRSALDEIAKLGERP